MNTFLIIGELILQMYELVVSVLLLTRSLSIDIQHKQFKVLWRLSPATHRIVYMVYSYFNHRKVSCQQNVLNR